MNESINAKNTKFLIRRRSQFKKHKLWQTNGNSLNNFLINLEIACYLHNLILQNYKNINKNNKKLDEPVV